MPLPVRGPKNTITARRMDMHVSDPTHIGAHVGTTVMFLLLITEN